MKTEKKKIVTQPLNQLAPDAKLYIASILAITLIVFIRGLNNQVTNWDDSNYLSNTNFIHQLSLDNLKTIFSSYVIGNYHPLTILSYALEYHFWGLNPLPYHFFNLLLHLANSILVFLFIYRLTKKQVKVAAFTSVLFALHPMHVESVAWISERKDVLYTFFFFASLLFYFRYLDSGKIKQLMYCLLLFLLSLLSKGQAVVLPVILLLIDYFTGRNFEKKTMLEKIPFFILAFIFGFIAIEAQRSLEAINEIKIPFEQSIFFGFYGLCLYILKSVIPFALSGYHPYPFYAGNVPVYVYLSPTIIIVLFFIVFKKFRQNKEIIFGTLFFLIPISLVLQFLPVGKAVIADRYTYIPYIGLFFIIGNIFNPDSILWIRSGNIKKWLVISIVFISALISWKRVAVWKDSITLWSDVLNKYPASELALSERAFAFLDVNDMRSALDDCRNLVQLNPNSVSHNNQLATVLNLSGNYEEAIAYLNKGILIDSTYSQLYLNRGIAFTNIKKYEEAIADYTHVIKLDPRDDKAYMNRGGVYTDQLGKYDLGIKDFEKVFELAPDNTDVLLNLGLALFKNGDLDSSIVKLDIAIQRSSMPEKAYFLKSLVCQTKEDFRCAYDNASRAKELGYSIDAKVIDALRVKAELK